MASAKIKKGDKVVVLSGKDKGKTGEVTRAMPKDGKVLVSGVNIATRHRKPSQANPQVRVRRASSEGLLSAPVGDTAPMGLELQGRRALVTGASGGIGNAIARALHAKGATWSSARVARTSWTELVAKLGDRAEAVEADLSDRASVESLVDRAGAIDVLVANAGVPAAGVYDTFTPDDEVDRALDVNLRAPMQLALALLPGMKEREAGHLVFIYLDLGQGRERRRLGLRRDQFGLRGWAIGLRDDLRGSGVGVTTVFPGFIWDAGMFHDSGTKLPSTVRTRTPDQVAKAVVKGIERDKGEIDVAPLSLRFGSVLTAVAPEFLSKMQIRLGSRKVAEPARVRARRQALAMARAPRLLPARLDAPPRARGARRRPALRPARARDRGARAAELRRHPPPHQGPRSPLPASRAHGEGVRDENLSAHARRPTRCWRTLRGCTSRCAGSCPRTRGRSRRGPRTPRSIPS